MSEQRWMEREEEIESNRKRERERGICLPQNLFRNLFLSQLCKINRNSSSDWQFFFFSWKLWWVVKVSLTEAIIACLRCHSSIALWNRSEFLPHCSFLITQIKLYHNTKVYPDISYRTFWTIFWEQKTECDTKYCHTKETFWNYTLWQEGSLTPVNV